MRRLQLSILAVMLGSTRLATAQVAAVTVEGQRELTSSRDATAASTVLPADDLEGPGLAASDALADVPGVQVQRSGARSDLATASIRGAGNAQVPVYLAGIRINDDVSGTADLSTLPLWMLHRIEVFRGAAPAGVDQMGVGGAILFEPRLPKRNGVRAGAGVGSFGERALWTSGAVQGHHSSALVGVRLDTARNDYAFVDDRGTRFDASDDVERTRPNADFEQADVWAITRHRLSSSVRLLTVYNGFAREQGVTGVSNTPARSSRARVERQLIATTATARCGVGDSCALSATTSLLRSRIRLRDPAAELGLGAAGSATDAERFSQRIGIVRRWDRWELGGGVRQSFDRLAVDAVRSRRATTRPSAHLTFRPARAWTLQTLAAGECHTTKSDGVGDTCGVLEPTARFGASWRATPALELVSNVGRYVRVPTLGELFGTAPLVRGNAALLSETALATDVGVRIRDRSHRRSYLGVYLDVYGFARWSDDLIAFQRTSFGALTPFNVGSARTLGAELQTGARPLSWLQLDASATLLDPRDTTEDRRLANDLLPYRSRLTASGTVRILLPDMPSVGFSKSTLSTAVLHRASRVADPAGLIVIADQTTLDAELRTAIARWVFVGVAGRNLTDARQFDTVGLPLPGRSVHASVEMRVE